MRATSGISAILLTLAATTPLSAQRVAEHPRVRQAVALLETWLDAQRDYEQIPGLSAAIVHDQELVWSGGVGLADREREAAASAGTMYSICSISKLFTSIAVMQQRDAGHLRLDDPVAKHLSWFDIRRTHPDAPDIDIEGLLTHSSGLPRESDHPYWSGPGFEFPSREEIIDRLSEQETLYPAETYFQYSNLGMALAGEVVSAASGMPYADYVRQRILEPIGLTSTSPEMPEAERGKRLAVGYSAIQRDGERVPVTFFTARGIAPAAGFASTVEDLGRFASWQFRVLDREDEADVLDANTLREMQRVHWVDPDFSTHWGLGFTVARTDDHTFVGHGGSCPGFRTQLLIEPREQIAAVFMANAQGVDTNDFVQAMYRILAPALRAAAKDSSATPAPRDTMLARYVGNYATGFSGEVAVFEWEDGLATVGLPTMAPERNMSRLRKTGDHTFRRIRDNDDLAEALVFEMGADGRAERIIWNSNIYRRIR
ncbi:MAG: serine hydrolase domain-containing protein [Longimicrobiales bacterium]